MSELNEYSLTEMNLFLSCFCLAKSASMMTSSEWNFAAVFAHTFGRGCEGQIHPSVRYLAVFFRGGVHPPMHQLIDISKESEMFLFFWKWRSTKKVEKSIGKKLFFFASCCTKKLQILWQFVVLWTCIESVFIHCNQVGQIVLNDDFFFNFYCLGLEWMHFNKDRSHKPHFWKINMSW